MTRGISEETLIKILKDHGQYRNTGLAHDLEYVCTELSPWMPIESAPIGKKIRVFSPLSYVKGQHELTLHDELDKLHFTHFCELPDDPK